jgi:DNA-binding NarL/FixJ family response regulator
MHDVEDGMAYPRTAAAFNVDSASMACLREALPDWRIDVFTGVAASSMPANWSPLGADLFVVGARENVVETLGLCRFLAACTGYSHDVRAAAAEPLEQREDLRNQATRTHAVVLVFIPCGQDHLIARILEAGASCCLMQPIHAKDIVRTVANAQSGNQPSRHTLNLQQAQRKNLWRDDGGEG